MLHRGYQVYCAHALLHGAMRIASALEHVCPHVLSIHNVKCGADGRVLQELLGVVGALNSAYPPAVNATISTASNGIGTATCTMFDSAHPLANHTGVDAVGMHSEHRNHYRGNDCSNESRILTVV